MAAVFFATFFAGAFFTVFLAATFLTTFLTAFFVAEAFFATFFVAAITSFSRKKFSLFPSIFSKKRSTTFNYVNYKEINFFLQVLCKFSTRFLPYQIMVHFFGGTIGLKLFNQLRFLFIHELLDCF